MAKWREFENLVARIYQELLPESEVNLDDKILGHDSKTIRQIDVSIRHRLAGHKLLIIVQAKDYKKPADLPDVGEFATVIRDVRASKGIMVCNAGFTESRRVPGSASPGVRPSFLGFHRLANAFRDESRGQTFILRISSSRQRVSRSC